MNTNIPTKTTTNISLKLIGEGKTLHADKVGKIKSIINDSILSPFTNYLTTGEMGETYKGIKKVNDFKYFKCCGECFNSTYPYTKPFEAEPTGVIFDALPEGREIALNYQDFYGWESMEDRRKNIKLLMLATKIKNTLNCRVKILNWE